jgi:hypothetical protein
MASAFGPGRREQNRKSVSAVRAHDWLISGQIAPAKVQIISALP